MVAKKENNGWRKLGVSTQPKVDETWSPELVDTVEGVYVEKRSNLGQRKSNMYVLKQANGKTIGVWGSAVVDRRMPEINIGDEVRIVYIGKETNKNTGFSYKNFEFYIKDGGITGETEKKENPDDIPF